MTPLRRAAAAAAAVAVAAGLSLLPSTAADAGASARLVTSSEYYDGSDAKQHIAGEVVNDGDTYVSAPQVAIEYRNASEQVLGSAVVNALADVLAPGERSPFGVGFSLPAGYDHYVVTGVTAAQTSTPPNHQFTLAVTGTTTDGTGRRYVGGTIRNDNTAFAEGVVIMLTARDSTGRVVGVAATTPDGYDLTAGQTDTWQAVLSPGFPSYTGLALLAESLSAPSPLPSPLPSPSPSPSASSPAPGTGSPSPSVSASPSPSSAAPSTDPSASADPSTSPSPACAPPVLQLSHSEITVGAPVEATVIGTPGAGVVLEAYSRPASTYGAVRPVTTLAADGTARFTVGPATNTRLRAQQTGCDTPSASALLRVHPVLTFAVRRDDVRRYSFSGRILPGAVNAGRTVTLDYQLPGMAPVRRAVMAVQADGTFATTVVFTGSARLGVWVRTGADMVNEDGRSATRSLLVY